MLRRCGLPSPRSFHLALEREWATGREEPERSEGDQREEDRREEDRRERELEPVEG